MTKNEASYEKPQAVFLNSGTRGCKHGNQILGECTTGGYPKGKMADCRNGAFATGEANEGTCAKGSKPGIT
jgi:hypothetical protein